MWCVQLQDQHKISLARVVYFPTDSVHFLHYLLLLAQLFSGYTFLLFFVTDINECSLGLHTCQQACTNNEGCYDCSCFDGFTLHANGSCVGKSIGQYFPSKSLIKFDNIVTINRAWNRTASFRLTQWLKIIPHMIRSYYYRCCCINKPVIFSHCVHLKLWHWLI